MVTKGRHDEAVEIFKRFAALNKKPLPKNILESLKEDEEAAKKEKIFSIFKAPTLLKRIAIFLYLW